MTVFKEQLATSLIDLKYEIISPAKLIGHHYLLSTPLYVVKGKNR